MSYPTPAGPLEEGTVQIREVDVSYRGARRTVLKKIDGPDTVVQFMRKLVGGDAREHFVVLHLDGRHRAIGYQVVSIGTATASLIHPREIFQPAIAIGAAGIIGAHNHPSGDPVPAPISPPSGTHTKPGRAQILRCLGGACCGRLRQRRDSSFTPFE